MRADSRAMLQLLLERDQTYADIGAVIGSDPDAARAQARSALAELGGADPGRELADYLLGQADPVGRADAVRRLRDDSEAHELASRIVAGLREIAPQANLPRLSEGGDAAVAVADRPGPDEPSDGLSKRQRRVMLGLIAAAAILLGVVVLTAGLLDGDDEPGGEPTTAAAQPDDAIQVKLEPQGSGEGRGEAVFGLATADQLFLDVDVSGLEPPSPDQTYVIWLLLTPRQGYPVSPIEVSENGAFTDRFPIPRFAIPIAGRSRFLDVSLVDRARLQAQVDDFAQSLSGGDQAQLPVLEYEGESALRGEIPATGGPALLDEGSGGEAPAP